MDYISLGLISEELEYVDTSLRVIMSVHAGLNCLSLLTWGTEDQKQRYLVPQAQGRKLATYGLTEPAAGSDVRGMQTVAVKKGDRYFLTGEKMWISLADVADNFLVFAWTRSREEEAARSVGHQRVHRRAGLQGLLERHAEGEVGHPRGQHRLLQDGRRRGARKRTSSAGRARASRLRCSRSIRAATRSPPARPGLIRACRDASANYAKERQTFGVAIAEHQLVKEMIAQMESDYQVARLLWMRSGFLKNQRPPQHARDRPGQVVRDRRVRARRRRRGAGSRRQRLLGRVPGRPFLSQLQGRGHLRRHARDPQADAGRLRARLPGGSARRAASCRKFRVMSSDLSLEFLRVVEQAAIACAHTMGQGDGHKSDQAAVEAMRTDARQRADRRDDRHRRRRARRGADAVHR